MVDCFFGAVNVGTDFHARSCNICEDIPLRIQVVKQTDTVVLQ